MAQRDNLYRRLRGIYVLRIIVPVRYRALIGQREIHASTRTSHLANARAIAARLLKKWYVSLEEFRQVDKEKLRGNAPLLTDAGKISLTLFCESFGVGLEAVVLASEGKIRSRIEHFVELMGDLTLGELNRDVVKDYVTKMQNMPCNLYLMRRKYKISDTQKLIEIALADGQPVMSRDAIGGHIESLGSMLKWAKSERYLLITLLRMCCSAPCDDA